MANDFVTYMPPGQVANYDLSYHDPNNGYKGVGPVDTHWEGPADGFYSKQFSWKSMPPYSVNVTSGVQVNTDALRMFAANLRWLLEPLNFCRQNLQSVKLAPGNFFDANELIGKVVGAGAGGAIQPTTLAFIEKAIQAVTTAANELEVLASKYKTGEELNRATGRDLLETIEYTKAYINGAVGGAAGGPGVG
ncbi:hypothetical protein [Lentzea sp. NPDC059081]|uniref:hypothetical protein n=1 Tax=Lentzea sp. NPDC059081 TaxID=3346719 RepID=UPI00368065CB